MDAKEDAPADGASPFHYTRNRVLEGENLRIKKIYHVCFLLAFKAHQQKPVFSRAPSTVRLSCCNLGGGGGGWYVMINLECTSSVLSTRSGDEATSGQKMSERL